MKICIEHDPRMLGFKFLNNYFCIERKLQRKYQGEPQTEIS